MSRNPVKGAVICNDRYPVQEASDTAYITDTLKERIYQYEIRYEHDTIYTALKAGCDTVTVTKVMQRIKTLPAPPAQTKVVTRTVESTAKLTIMESKLQAANRSRNLFMWLLLAALLYILYRLAKDRYYAKY
jgi:hypothetical protein